MPGTVTERKVRRALRRAYGIDGWFTERDAVEEYYGHRLTVEEPDGMFRFVWRLQISGRTIACSDVEHEVWEEAFDNLADLLADGKGAYGCPPIDA